MLTMTTGGLLLDILSVGLLFFFPPSLPAHKKTVRARVTAGPKENAEGAKQARTRELSNRIARLALFSMFLGSSGCSFGLSCCSASQLHHNIGQIRRFALLQLGELFRLAAGGLYRHAVAVREGETRLVVGTAVST